jgi:hypothetical protein
MPARAKRVVRRAAVLILLALAAMPASVIATLAFLPFWSFVERRFGIESVGHSGPADWCFAAVYVAWMTLTGIAWFALTGRARRRLDAERDSSTAR